MVKHYCDFCGTEVHDLNSYEVEIIIQPWEENMPLTYQKRHQLCKKCMYKLIGTIEPLKNIDNG